VDAFRNAENFKHTTLDTKSKQIVMRGVLMESWSRARVGRLCVAKNDVVHWELNGRNLGRVDCIVQWDGMPFVSVVSLSSLADGCFGQSEKLLIDASLLIGTLPYIVLGDSIKVLMPL
jgi:hypothetical protein